MINPFYCTPDLQDLSEASTAATRDQWPTFEEMLKRLHQEGLYLHPDQLAEFLLWHGIPVDLHYVPQHLQPKAQQINQAYQGDMAKLG